MQGGSTQKWVDRTVREVRTLSKVRMIPSGAIRHAARGEESAQHLIRALLLGLDTDMRYLQIFGLKN
eukprot:8141289-Pyramimonas_sp.AAC.1